MSNALNHFISNICNSIKPNTETHKLIHELMTATTENIKQAEDDPYIIQLSKTKTLAYELNELVIRDKHIEFRFLLEDETKPLIIHADYIESYITETIERIINKELTQDKELTNALAQAFMDLERYLNNINTAEANYSHE